MSPRPPSPPSPGWAPPSGPPVSPGGPPPQHAAGRQPKPRRTPDPALVREAGRQIGRFALLVASSFLCMSLQLPWQAAALLFSVPAVVVGVLALRAVIRAGMGAGAVTFTIVGTLLAALMVLGQVAALVLPPVRELQECQANALSPSAERECQSDYERRLDELTQLRSLAA